MCIGKTLLLAANTNVRGLKKYRIDSSNSSAVTAREPTQAE